MTAKAYLAGLGISAPTSPLPTTFLWHEPFDQADLAAFAAQYSAYDWALYFVYDPAGVIAISGGALIIPGTADGPNVEFGPPQHGFSAPELWCKIQYTVSGSPDVRDTRFDAYISGYNGGGSNVAETNFGSRDTTSFTAAPTANSSGRHPGGMLLSIEPLGGGAQPTASTNYPLFFEVGSHVVIVCISNVGGTTKAELWRDATRGDAPAAWVSAAGDATTQLYSTADIACEYSFTPSKTSFTDIVLVAGDRASDPFGIL
jgi:hypothetical protein